MSIKLLPVEATSSLCSSVFPHTAYRVLFGTSMLTPGSAPGSGFQLLSSFMGEENFGAKAKGIYVSWDKGVEGLHHMGTVSVDSHSP